MPNDTQSTAKTKSKRVANETGHWQMPLDGHGLAYFDELRVAYKTIPAHGSAEDNWARAVAKAVQVAQAAEDACATAKQMADGAAAAAAAAPTDAKLKKDAEDKANLVVTAEAKHDEARKSAELMKGALDSKAAAAAIIEQLLLKKKLLDDALAEDPTPSRDALKRRGVAVWSDILTFESALLRMVWFEPLKTKLQSLRQEYRHAVGAVAAEVTEATYLDLKNVTEEKDLHRLQAEAANLMSELHWSLVTAPMREWQKTRLTIKLGIYSLAVCSFILVLGCLRIYPSCAAASCCPILNVVRCLHLHCPTLALVMLFGAAGATMSAFQRIQNGSASGAGLLNLRDSKWGSLSIGVAPLIGATSALLLTLIFAGNIISGNIFPKVTLRADDGGTNALAKVTTQTGINTMTNLLSNSNAVSAGSSPTNANLLNITNSTPATNQVNTNTPILTNPPAGTSDPAMWRDCKTFFQHHWCVASGADLALLLIWAFIAGFSERLVPDMLSRLAKKAEEKV